MLTMLNRLKDENGIALPAALFIMVIVVILGFAALAIAENQTILVRNHQQREQALHYAEAGIHSYTARLNNNSSYYTTNESDALQGTDIAFEKGSYNLTVTAPSITNPAVTIRSTGKVQNSNNSRTVEVELRKKQFIQNLMTTNTGNDIFWYVNRYMRGDIVNGPLHVNGDLVVNGFNGDGSSGPEFYGPVTYSGSYTIEGLSLGTTVFHAGNPVKVERTAVPQMNESIEAKADHIYVGRTCIYLQGNSVTVRNQQSDSSESLTIPETGMVIYVKGGSGNNKWSSATGNVYVSGALNGRLTIVAENDIYITATDPTVWSKPNSSDTPAASGGVTYSDLSSASSIDSGNIETVMASCNDMLGLIANRNVRILHVNWPSQTGYWTDWGSPKEKDVAPVSMNIHAAILAVTGSFEYEEPLQGPKKGTLTVIGSITQYKTGPMAGFAPNILDLPDRWDLLHERRSGYGKAYYHDPRFMYELPPNFLEPVNSGWEIIEWREL